MTQPKCIYELDIDVYGFKFTVPSFVVPGQRDELIVGSNVIRPIIQKMKSTDKYWELISSSNSDPDCEQFIKLLSCISRWSGPELRDVVGTVQLKQAVTLLPQREYVVWGRLPSQSPISPGSTVMVGPTSTRSTPKNILVGRVVTPMWGDSWISVKVLNPTQNAITLRRNAKIADVFPCLAVEELPITQGLCRLQVDASNPPRASPQSAGDPVQLLKDCGLADIDVDGCEASETCKRKLAELVLSYKDVFSRDRLDCGEAKGFVHRIRLSDDRPFYLPFRRVPPGHYQQLREVLSDMEMKGIISKSVNDLLVFAPSEEEALRRLEVVFSRLRTYNLKLSQKKCHFLRKSVRFLGHVVDASGVSVDQEKVTVISGFRKEDLMDADGCTPSQKKDPTINRVLHFVERKRRPSRREQDKESQMVLRILKQWERLTVLDGILYRVTRDPMTKHKRFQFVLPDSLKSQALAGVHDLAGHHCLLSVGAFSGMMWSGMYGAMSGTVQGGRGKRKLADKWEPAVYTVVASKPHLHIYKIRDRNGQVRTVHRNLLLSVNFLPLDNTLFAEDDLQSVDAVSHDPSTSDVLDREAAVSEPDSAAEHSVVDSSSRLNMCERDRTASWVCDQSGHAGVESVNDSLDDLPVSRAPSLTVHVPSNDAAAIPLQSPVPYHAPPFTDILSQGPENSVRSRCGRIVKPVHRLIETMVQFTSRFSVAPQSAFLLF
ncbi:hypothetical protein SKAU_G00326420 [Synaphobranchus kaupii]|uniref:ribonuclease H n=1 Tax=Synaphobranchus kaupii TaxID=118154 RepID=A0A9Q1EPU1_SYNKA|nr:hypothetical protein SKAU_G00326420 [Synaphobranchus kaupii]